MKKKALLFGALLGALTISSITFAAISINKQEAAPVSASGNYNDNTSIQNGLFVRVTDPSTISNGEKLLVIGDGNKTIQYHVGASYHYWVTTEFSEFATYTDDYIYANGEKGELVTFQKNADGSFYLKLDHYADWASNSDRGAIKSGYLVHEAYDNNGVTAFGDLYIRNKKDKPSQNAARWNLTYTGGHMRIVSKSGRLLHWKGCGGSSWSSFIASTHPEWDSDINLYRKVSSADMMIVKTANPTKTTYITGDSIDLTGLQIRADYYVNSEVVLSINSSYNSQSSLFKPLYVAYYDKSLHFTWCGIEGAFEIDVDHNVADEHLYYKPDEKIQDLRGTYLLACSYQPGPDSAFVMSTIDTSSISSGAGADANSASVITVADENPICDTKYVDNHPELDEKRTAVTNNLVEIVCNPMAGNVDVDYAIKIGDYSLYIDTSVSNEDPSFGKLKLGSVSFATTANRVFTDAHNYVYIGEGISRQLVFDKSTLKVTTVISGDLTEDQIPLCLYKLKLTKNLNYDEEIETFRATFFSKTSAYDATAATRSVSKANWESLASTFNSLRIDAQSYLASLTYSNHNHEASGSFEEMVDRYDSILNTYYDLDGFSIIDGDFMRRDLADTYQDKRAVSFVCKECSITGAAKAEYKAAYNATIVPAANHTFPDSIAITMGGTELAGAKYSYNSANGQITINKDVITDVIEITAEGKLAQYNVVYIGVDENGDELINNVPVTMNTTHALLSYAGAGFTHAPDGKRFKCWMVRSAERNPGYEITVDEEIEVVAIYESNSDAANTIESSVYTKPYLSYDYVKNGENDYTFTNITIRFRGIVSKTLWDALDEGTNNITGFGILYSTEEYLAGADLKNFYDDLVAETKVDNNIKLYRSQKSVPTLFTAAQYDELTVDSYSWNLRKYVNTVTVEKLTTRYVAVAFIETRDYGPVFLKPATASVKSAAQDLLNKPGYNEESLDGSLNYLANIGA